MEMLEVKTLISEMKNSLNQLINKLDKSRGKKSVSLKLSQKKCKQTVTQRVNKGAIEQTQN